ncbi:MAG: hypothetical protein A2X94_15095 [Bdellovibrionales bacterium GWB1_55_8]|nr:MAG: hypothetical protein A2X94_15095 [Bdellovibrionales bacterium GWB1_55_8]
MTDFQCEGIDKSGKKVVLKLQAGTEGELRMALRAQGVRPVRIKKLGAMNQDIGSLFGSPGVTNQQLVIFTRQLYVLVNAGIPLMQSLELLSEQESQGALRTMLIAIKEKVAAGGFLWESLAAHPKVFPKLYVSLIRAGEASGSMDQMLKRLSRYLEDSDRLRKQLKSAMMYPAVIVSIGLGVIILMLAFVIPKFEEMLSGAGQELPMVTRIVITTSHFVVDNLHFIITGIGVTVFLLKRYFDTAEGRALKDRMFFKAPIFGPIMQLGGVARFARTLQTLLSSGINLVDAVDICRATIDNVVLEEATAKIRTDIEAGKTLGTSIGKLKQFPKMTHQMILVGESTGALDKMLEKIADFYEADVEALVGGLSKLIEPLILVFLGGTVGGLMVAMYLPIFKLAAGSE